MNSLDIFLKKTEILSLQMESGVDTTFNDAYIALFEDGDESTGFIDKISDAISNIIEKIQKLFHDAKCAITKHFQDNEVEKKAKEVDEATKGINKKVSYKSRKEAIDLSKVTLEDVYKAKDFNEVEALMTKYRKQRNKAIAIGTIITLSVAGIGAFVIKKKNDLNNELEKQKSVAEKRLKESRSELGNLKIKMEKKNETINQMKDDMNDMKKELDAKSKMDIAKVRVNRKIRNISKTTDGISLKMKTEQAKANATVEVAKNICQDIASESKTVVSDLLNPNTKPIAKATGVMKGVSNTKNIVKNAPDKLSEGRLSTLKKSYSSIKKEGKLQKEKCLKIGNSIKNMPKTDKRRAKLVELFKNEKSIYDKLVSDARALSMSIADIEKNSNR